MGRASRGVIGIKLTTGDELAGVVAIQDDETLLTITENGYGKRTEAEEFSVHGRGTKGQIAYGCNSRTGEVVGVLSVGEGAEVIIITSQGQTVRIASDAISLQGRGAMGVRAVNIDKPDFVVGVDRSADEDEGADQATDEDADENDENE